MKNLLAIIFIALSAACNTQNTPGTEAEKDSAAIITNSATIPTERAVISQKAIASFYKKVPDDLNDWHFSVDVYETKETFHYLMKMQYKELIAEDTLKIPNFGIEPKIEIHEGKDKYACIIGFLDKENKFLEYKKVSVKDDNLKVTILHHYAVSTYESK